MTTLRRAFTLAAAFLLAVSPLTTAWAVSLYDGVKVRPAPPACVLPGKSLIPALPQALAGVAPAVGTDLAAPQAPSVPTASQARPLADLEATGAKLAAPAAQVSAALDAQFDAGIAEFVGGTIAEHFGPLAPNERPGVVIVKRAKKSSPLGAPTDGEMVGDIKEAKRTNAEREQTHIRILQRTGARYDAATALVARPDFARDGDIQLQEVPPSWGGRSAAGRLARWFVGEVGAALGLLERPEPQHNIMVVKRGKPRPGRPERIIVHSAHIDKVDAGWGVIDNWVGTALQAHLYASVKDMDTEATHVFIAFTREEEGLVGSKFWLKSMSREQRALIEGDANYDTFAIKGGQTNSWENNSDEELLDLADKAVAEANKTRGPDRQISLIRDTLHGGDADSSSFRRQRPPIRGMTIYSGPAELLFSKIHSENDEFGAFDPLGYKNVYHMAMALIRWWDAHSLAPAPPVGVN